LLVAVEFFDEAAGLDLTEQAAVDEVARVGAPRLAPITAEEAAV